jgi:hypothetical protein
MATGSQSFTLPVSADAVSDPQNSTRGALATIEFHGMLPMQAK